MPYIAIKAYKKDAATKQAVVDEINRILLEKWGCPQSAISISVEEFAPEEWEEQIHQGEMGRCKGEMLIKDGNKAY